MATHAFITSWLMAPSGKGAALGTEWSVGFRGQLYSVVSRYSQVLTCRFSYSPGSNSVGISISSSDGAWKEAFPGESKLAFCGYYMWRGEWFGGFIDWWPLEGGRRSRDLKNTDGQFEAAARTGIKEFCFVITDMHGRRTNFGP